MMGDERQPFFLGPGFLIVAHHMGLKAELLLYQAQTYHIRWCIFDSCFAKRVIVLIIVLHVGILILIISKLKLLTI